MAIDSFQIMYIISNSNFVFRIQIQFLESKFSFLENVSYFYVNYVMIYNSKTSILFLNTDLDSKLKWVF